MFYYINEVLLGTGFCRPLQSFDPQKDTAALIKCISY